MNKILKNILDFTCGGKFYRFENADGKRWIVPTRGMCTALNLYQPSGIKGKMVKALLPHLHWMPPVRKVIKAQTINCRLNNELHKLFCETFGVQDIEFAIFEGTPCVHQKITMQLSCGKRILGYCKLSDSNDIKALFDKESTMLEWLAGRGVNNIPQALHCGTMTNGTHIFVQSTAKSASSSIPHEWGTLQQQFIDKLHSCTKQRMKFEDSDFFRSIVALEGHLHWLPNNINSSIVEQGIAIVREQFGGKDVEFSAYHGDFTPWNMFVENGRLFVFDFEYAAKSYPPGLDRYHHFTQTAVFEKHWSANDFASYMQTEEAAWIEKDSYLLYLLDVVSHYTMREGGKVTGDATTPFTLWGKVLEKLI